MLLTDVFRQRCYKLTSSSFCVIQSQQTSFNCRNSNSIQMKLINSIKQKIKAVMIALRCVSVL